MEKQVLHSELAGSWYDADPQALAQTIRGLLSKVKAKPLEDVCAMILPHAGYRYSGLTASHGMKLIEGRRYKRVVALGPSHRVGLRNCVSLPQATHYSTPLGEVPLDEEFINKLIAHESFVSVPVAHVGEHSVQIELPFLQLALKDFSFVPIVVGQLDQKAVSEIADILVEAIDSETLVIVSSDFTHYGANFNYLPFRTDVAENIRKLDMGAYEYIERKDSDGFKNYIARTGATICGRNPIRILLAMLPKSASGHLLDYTTSGEMLNDYQSSVSYMSIAFTGKWGAAQRSAAADTFGLSPEEQNALLKLARGALSDQLANKKPSSEMADVDITPGMQRVMGAFVTLNKHGNLRGCIGEIFPRRELYKAITEQAVNAGLHDYRFPSVKQEELAEIEFEISALSPPRPVKSHEDIVIGKHGIVLRKQGRQAVYLPQVAPEQGWDVEQTLTHLSLKAGLSPDAWKNNAEFLVFEALVFSEAH